MEAIEITDCVCPTGAVRAVHDTMDVLGGKWKISILSSMCYFNERRFSDILSLLSGISNKQLSKELKELEQNQLIERIVMPTQPVTVKYKLTEYGWTLKDIINNLSDWGVKHRQVIIAK